jgi:putative ABC transport system permease protein
VRSSQTRTDLDRIRGRLLSEHPSEYPPGSMAVASLREVLSAGARPVLLVLLASVGFVLLIACANVANLLLARALRRSREITIRSALGAGRWRLARQLLTESLLLAFAGGALGTALAAASLQGLSRLAPATLPRLDQVGMDPRVLGFAALLTLATGILFGILPALKLSRADLRGSLASESAAVAGGSAARPRSILIVADLALALMLLAGAGLMVKTLAHLLGVDPGFRPERVLSLQLAANGGPYDQDAAVLGFQERLLEKVRALPGVEAAALSGQVPLGGNGDRFGFHVEGRAAKPAEDLSAERYSVTPDYFRVMGVALVRGRLFTPADREGSSPVVIVSETAARRIFPGEDPLNRRARVGDAASGPWRTIVGIVRDVHHEDLAEVPAPQMYLPQAQLTDNFLVLVVRSSSRPQPLAGPIREIVRGLDPGVPVWDVATMEERLGRSVAARRFVARLLSGFALLAVLLAAIGLYGVISVALGQRTREIGVRVALGATKADILRLVFRSAVATLLAGLAVGLAATLAAGRLLSALLFDVSPRDPATLALAVGALSAVALAAHGLPALRAARTDPMVALKSE